MNKYVRERMIFDLYLNTNHQCSWGAEIHWEVLYYISFLQLQWYVRVMTGLEILEVYFNQLLIIKVFGQADILFLLSYFIISKHQELLLYTVIVFAVLWCHLEWIPDNCTRKVRGRALLSCSTFWFNKIAWKHTVQKCVYTVVKRGERSVHWP